MNPLLSGSTTSDLPLIVFGRTSSRSRSPMSQPPRERPPRTENSSTPHHPHPRHRATSNRERRHDWSLSAVEPTFTTLSSTGLPKNRGTNRRIHVTEPPKPRWPSGESFLPIPSPSPDTQRSPRATSNRARLRRGVSVNVTTLNQITLGDGVKPKQVALSRSQSLWTHKKGSTSIGDNTPEEGIPTCREKPLSGPQAEKRRVMNVRRAKKMQQVQF